MPDFLLDTEYWQAAIRLSIPLALAALGVLIAERSGVMNIGMEGCMLMGAAGGSVVAVKSGSPEAGILAALAAGCATGAVLGAFTLSLPGNQVVIGISVNLLALGASGIIVREAFGDALSPPNSPPFPELALPLLERLPALGEILFRFDVVTYVAGLLVPAMLLFLRSQGGVRLRAVGDSARSAAAVGLHIFRTRWGALLFGSALGGLAGGYLSVVALSFFVENGIAGRGYVALALVVFGRWNPIGVAAAALVVGSVDALQLRLQATTDFSAVELLTALPYLSVIVLLLLQRGRLSPPRELGRSWRGAASSAD